MEPTDFSSIMVDGVEYVYNPSVDTWYDPDGNEYNQTQDGSFQPVVTISPGLTAQGGGGYKEIAERIAPGINAKVEQTTTPGESWLTTIQKIVPALAMTAQQAQLMSLNIERAKKGLPPIDITKYTGVGVNVGLSPSTQNLVIFGGLALLAVLFLKGKK